MRIVGSQSVLNVRFVEINWSHVRTNPTRRQEGDLDCLMEELGNETRQSAWEKKIEDVLPGSQVMTMSFFSGGPNLS